VEVRSPEGAHRPGLLARWSRALAESGVNIVTLLSTGGRFSFVFGLPDAESARRLLTEEVGELGRPPYPLRKVALITVVGVPTPEVTEAVRRTDISVLGLVAHPDSATVAVPDRWGPTALRSLHRALIPSR
jgi:aspartokinase